MPFISNTNKDREEMLKDIGVSSFEELIDNIPLKFRLNDSLNLEKPLSELEIIRKIDKLAEKNKPINKMNSFLGAGLYDHFVPAAVDHILIRPEFLTAYTPYQAEVSQGTLQAIYEYQTMICELTGMDVSNAGMYDGATAIAEAILMAVRKTKKYRVVLSNLLHPNYKKVILSYTENLGIELVYINSLDGSVDLNDLKEKMDEETACFVLQTPNFYGIMEDSFAIEEIVHSYKKALFIVSVDPVSLALLNAPNEYNVDIVVGEGQSLGNKMNFGGPLFGFLATNQKFIRTMPGRIVGATIDSDGNKAYCLTMQAREQHIRREKATSNICSNQSLCCLAATVYLSLLGVNGFVEVARQSTQKAHYLASKISEIKGFELFFDKPFFREFVIKTPIPTNQIIDKLKEKNILPGLDLAIFGREGLLISVTEVKTKNDLDNFINNLKEVANV